MVIQGFTGFDWDDGNRGKCQKHGLTLTDIESVFWRTDTVIGVDKYHSHTEKRFLAIGLSPQERHMLVVFTLRSQEGKVLVRPVSARYMHRKEIRKYGQATPSL